MANASTSPTEPDTITVRVPITFRRRGGRKTISHPAGVAAPIRPVPHQTNSALVNAIARAFRWRKLIESGAYATIQEIADAEQVNPSYVSRVMRLTLLAPDIVETILDGKPHAAQTLDGLLRPFPVEWKAQQEALVNRPTS